MTITYILEDSAMGGTHPCPMIPIGHRTQRTHPGISRLWWVAHIYPPRYSGVAAYAVMCVFLEVRASHINRCAPPGR